MQGREYARRTAVAVRRACLLKTADCMPDVLDTERGAVSCRGGTAVFRGRSVPCTAYLLCRILPVAFRQIQRPHSGKQAAGRTGEEDPL